MNCKFCDNKFKYKCPKCNSLYCSLVCFKSPAHKELDAKIEQAETEVPAETLQPQHEITNKLDGNNLDTLQVNEKFDKILNDPLLKNLLSEKSLQIHFSVILKLLKDLPENDQDLVNLKINDLRKGGVEENELVEEFIDRFLELNDTIEN